MSGQPIDAEDLAAALTAFSIEFSRAIFSPRTKSVDDALVELANGLEEVSRQMADTPAARAVALTGKMLVASEPHR